MLKWMTGVPQFDHSWAHWMHLWLSMAEGSADFLSKSYHQRHSIHLLNPIELTYMFTFFQLNQRLKNRININFPILPTSSNWTSDSKIIKKIPVENVLWLIKDVISKIKIIQSITLDCSNILLTILVGGLVAIFYFPIYWESHHPIFFRGVAQPPTRHPIKIPV